MGKSWLEIILSASNVVISYLIKRGKLNKPQVIKVTIPLDPVAKARARTAFKDGKVRSYTPDKTKNAEALVVSYLEEYRGECFGRCVPIKLTAIFYRVKSKWLPKRETLPFRRPDLDNFLKLISDAIKGVLIVDDAQITSIVTKKRWTQNGVGYIDIQLEEDYGEDKS